MKSKLYLVQGMFFTEDRIMSIGFDPEIGERAITQPAVFRTMFSGVIELPEDEDSGEGALLDHYGDSILADVRLNDESLSFVKKYNKRNDLIQYSLKKEGDLWVGYYNGSATGKGAVRCLLSPIDEKFFEPQGLEKFFN